MNPLTNRGPTDQLPLHGYGSGAQAYVMRGCSRSSDAFFASRNEILSGRHVTNAERLSYLAF